MDMEIRRPYFDEDVGVARMGQEIRRACAFSPTTEDGGEGDIYRAAAVLRRALGRIGAPPAVRPQQKDLRMREWPRFNGDAMFSWMGGEKAVMLDQLSRI